MKVDQQMSLAQTGAQVEDSGSDYDRKSLPSDGHEAAKGAPDGETHALPNLTHRDDPEHGVDASSVQGGVKQAEAITATWSKNSLRVVYIL